MNVSRNLWILTSLRLTITRYSLASFLHLFPSNSTAVSIKFDHPAKTPSRVEFRTPPSPDPARGAPLNISRSINRIGKFTTSVSNSLIGTSTGFLGGGETLRIVTGWGGGVGGEKRHPFPLERPGRPPSVRRELITPAPAMMGVVAGAKRFLNYPNPPGIPGGGPPPPPPPF